MTSLTVSIVTYQVNKQLFSKVLEGLGKAVRDAKGKSLLSQTKLTVVDNGNDVSYLREEIAGQEDFEGRVIDNPDNVGFGRAHNQALLECDSDMHLVLNPDAVMHPDGLSEGLAYLAEHEETVMISPYAENSDGSKAYLCKRYPSVVDLFMRGFLPASLQEAASERLARYECRDLDDTDATAGVCVVSGCCMLAKTASLKAVNGFSDHYFFKKEDIKDIIDQAEKENLSVVCTEKDFVKIPSEYKKFITPIKLDLKINESKRLLKIILNTIKVKKV